MKHVGKMKNNSAKIAVAFRTLPNDHTHCLVIGTNGLADSYHDSLMQLIESDAGQQANELADILAVRRFPDGNVMLGYLHNNGHLKRVPTNLVLMTPNTQTSIQLDELNKMIADQKGISLEELAVSAEGKKDLPVQEAKKELPSSDSLENKKLVEDAPYHPGYEGAVIDKPVTASDLRSMADKLFKEAQALRRKAEELEPAKEKTSIKPKKVKEVNE